MNTPWFYSLETWNQHNRDLGFESLHQNWRVDMFVLKLLLLQSCTTLLWTDMASLELRYCNVVELTVAPNAAAGGGKWTGGLKSMTLDCPRSSLWDLASDWAHWDRFYPSTDSQFICELKEGENRKAGCLRYAKLNAETWTNERLLAIDNENHYFSYNMEDNMFCGGLKGYVAKAQVNLTTRFLLNPLYFWLIIQSSWLIIICWAFHIGDWRLIFSRSA